MKLYTTLLNSKVSDSSLSNNYRIDGSYNPMQFVLRLSKEIHETLAETDSAIVIGVNYTEKQIQAFSTYLHETIHWWQHVGSNFGLMTSLKYPVQAHVAFNDLKILLNANGAFKSILEYDNMNSSKLSRVNRILNYWYDLEGATDIAFRPKVIEKYFKKHRFASIGHSYYMLWSSTIATLSTVVDFDSEFLPKIKEWVGPFKELASNKITGFDPEPESMQIPPIGTLAIYEGQARFTQIQYLYFASGKKLTMYDFAEARLLDGNYIEAFNIFLTTLGEKMPEMADNSIIGLFLLVCDVAINPTDGFPFNIQHFESFVYSIDPGWRFMLLCNTIKNNPEIKKMITRYSKEEYINVCEILSKKIACISPYQALQYINIVIDTEPSFKALLDEERVFKFKPDNLPIRLFFSKYLKFQQDKLQHPHFFCWPGVYLVENTFNAITLTNAKELFCCHEALYVNDVNDVVQFTLSDKYTSDNMEETFNDFFAWNCMYDMVRQWIIQDGPFSYDYQWLTTKDKQEEMREWANRIFSQMFKVHPDDFKILLFED